MSETLMIQISEVHPSILSRFNLNPQENFSIDLSMYQIPIEAIQKIFKDFSFFKKEILEACSIEEIIRLLIHYKLDEEAEELLNDCVIEEKNLNKKKLGRIMDDFDYEKKVAFINNIEMICENGWLEILIYSHKKGNKFTKLAAHKAAENGHFSCLIYLRENGCLFDISTLISAVEGGDLECVSFIYDELFKSKSSYLNTNLDIFTYIAAKKGYFPLLEFAKSKNISFHKKTALIALNYNHLDCFFFAFKNNCPVKKLDIKAAEKGLLEVLKFSQEFCSFSEDTFYSAAFSGNVECVAFLFEKKCPWNERVSFIAAQNGHFQCLKFLLENGCPLHKTCTFAALNNNHFDCLEFLLNFGAEKDIKLLGIANELKIEKALEILNKFGFKIEDLEKINEENKKSLKKFG